MKPTIRVIWLTFMGGTIGTLARFFIGDVSGQLMGLVLVNTLGAAALGWFNGDKRFDTAEQKAFWAVGLAGGFTTMSGLASMIVTWQSVLGWVVFAWALALFASGLASYFLAYSIARDRGAK